MAVNTGSEDAWQVRALISVDDGTSVMTINTLSEDVEIDIPERELDKIDLLSDNQITKHGGLGLCTITINGYTLQAGSILTGVATGYWDIFAEKPVKDAADPITVTISNVKTRYRVSILLTNDTAATVGSAAVTSGATYAGKRIVLADCFCTKGGPSGTMSANDPAKDILVFKGIAIDKAGAGNLKIESIALATVAALPALASYVPGTTKW